ncbi:MAG: hypothetical protein ACKVOQ_17970 [Cyclobacteriaceae bacterium]
MVHKIFSISFKAAWRGATGLSATSPRSFLAVGFPLLSLAEVSASNEFSNTGSTLIFAGTTESRGIDLSRKIYL